MLLYMPQCFKVLPEQLQNVKLFAMNLRARTEYAINLVAALFYNLNADSNSDPFFFKQCLFCI